MLGNVVLLCLFLFVVFSILAVQLLKGVMQNRCYDPNNMGGGFYEPGDIGYGVYVCSIAPDEGMLQCPPNNNYANHWYPVSTTHTLCAPSGVNPDSGVTSFDNFFTAFLTVFLVFTMEGWTEIMYTAQDAYSFWIWIFFFAIVIFGGIIAVNLFLVVITAQFCATKAADKAAQEEKQKLEAEEAQKRPDGEEPPKALEDQIWDGIFSCGMGGEPPESKRSKNRVKPALAQEVPKPKVLLSNTNQWASPRGLKPLSHAEETPGQHEMPNFGASSTSSPGKGVGSGHLVQDEPSTGSWRKAGRCVDSTHGSGVGQATGSPIKVSTPVPGGRPVTAEDDTRVSSAQGSPDADARQSNTQNLNSESKTGTVVKSGFEVPEDMEEDDEETGGIKPRITMEGRQLSCIFKKYAETAEEMSEKAAEGFAIQFRLKVMVKTDSFNNMIMIFIVLNTIVMASEHHGQPSWLTTTQVYLNYIFTGVFLLEMILKLLGLGFQEYTRDTMNCFDAIIVFASLCELAMGGGGVLSVLRTFRLMRIFKIVRFLPGLQRQMVVIIASVGQMGNFCLILLLYMFIYGILGMYLFGAKLEGRSNFNNLFRSMITVFQMLTIEDWPGVQFDAVEATTIYASFYFMSLIVGGNFVLSNLFVAILLEGFAERASEDEKTIRVAFENDRLKKFKNRLRKAFTAGSIHFQLDFWKQYTRLCRVHGGWEGLDRIENPTLYTPVTISQAVGGQVSEMAEDDFEPLPMSVAESRATSRRMSKDSDAIGGGLGEISLVPQPPSHPRPSDVLALPTTGAARPGSTWSSHAPATPLPPNSPPPMGAIISTGQLVPMPPRDAPPSRGGEMILLQKDMALKSSVVTPLGAGDGVETKVEEDDEDDEEREEKLKEDSDPFTFGNSLGCLAGDNWLREACAGVVRAPLFDQVILFFIGLNSITMAIERPSIEDDSTERLALNVMGFIFTGVFVVEAFVKVISWGLFFGPHAYLNDAWNKLDGFLVTVSIVDLCFLLIKADGGEILGILRILRLLRALRPLRVINRAPKLKRVVQTLMDSLGSIGDTIMISSVVYLIFGILSVQLFAGKLWYCEESEGTYNSATLVVTTKDDCYLIGSNWVNQPYNYDNLLQALLTLFYVSSFDGWVDVMYYTIDAHGVDYQPVEDSNELVALFFVVFLLIANFFILNMFVGVIVESFQLSSDPEATKNENLNRQRLERQQKKHQDRYDYCLKVYRLGNGWYEKQIVAFVESEPFDAGVTTIIVLNVLCMMVEHHGQPSQMTTILIQLNYLFTVIFAVEAILKIKAFGLTCYFTDAWNKFDFFIVIMSFVGIFIDEAYGDDGAVNPAFIRVMRVFRIARIMKLVKSAKGLSALLETTINALGQVASVCLLLFLIFFVYAAAGVALFGQLASPETNPANGISIHANFENFAMAMLTLFRISTGDNGNGVLKDAMRTAPACDPEATCKFNCCSDPYMAPFFFLSFTVVAQFVLLNVVVAVLMSELEESQKEQDAQDAFEQEQVERMALREAAESDAAAEVAKRQEEMKSAGVKFK